MRVNTFSSFPILYNLFSFFYSNDRGIGIAISIDVIADDALALANWSEDEIIFRLGAPLLPFQDLTLLEWGIEAVLFAESLTNGNRNRPVEWIEDFALQVEVAVTVKGFLKFRWITGRSRKPSHITPCDKTFRLVSEEHPDSTFFNNDPQWSIIIFSEPEHKKKSYRDGATSRSG
jgi:hypothetical protein